MKYSIFILCLISTIFLSARLFSQENNANIWYFGANAGVDFNYGVPKALTDGQLNTWEGCASICNQNGELLFYTDGQKIYNKNHQIMPNGNGLLGNYTSSQSSIIVPKPSSATSNNIYYVFTVDCWDNQFVNGLRYSVVDMSLNGGLGDVTSEKNILLHDKVAEKIAAVHHSNSKDIWVLTHDWGSNDYLAFLVTEDSVSTIPVVTSIGYNYLGDYTLGAGQLRFSKDGIYVASTINYIHRFELFKFNRATGILYDMLEFQDSDNFLRAWGVEFSTNQRFCYISRRPPEILLQFELKIWDYDSVLNSKTVVASTSGSVNDYDAGTLQIGPNGKIYLTRYDKTYISVINQPNNKGSACDFEEVGVSLNGRLCKWGLPNLFYYKGFKFFTGSEQDIAICQGDSVFLENHWQTTEGVYYDTLQINSSWDSIVNTHLTVLLAPEIPTISENNGVLMSSSTSGNQWYYNGNEIVGATSQFYQPFVNGIYQVAVGNEGCLSFSDEYLHTALSVHAIENNIDVYPNPFDNSFILNCNGKYDIKIYDIKGVLVYQKNKLLNKNTIYVNNLGKGVYILEITFENGQKSRKLISRL